MAVLLTTLPFTLTGEIPNDIKINSPAQVLQEIEITGAVPAERPFVTDTNFAQRFGTAYQLIDEILRRRRRELPIKPNDEQMGDPERADQCDLMLCRGQQVGRFIRSKNLGGMRIEGNHDWDAAGGLRVLS